MPTLNDYRDREHHSFSSINQFINICSLQYAFQRIYKAPKAFTPVSLIFGSVFHRVMEWVSLSRSEETVKAHEASALFIDLWQCELGEIEDIKLVFHNHTDPDPGSGRPCGCLPRTGRGTHDRRNGPGLCR